MIKVSRKTERESELMDLQVNSVTTYIVKNPLKAMSRAKVGGGGLTTDLMKDGSNFKINEMIKLFTKYLQS